MNKLLPLAIIIGLAVLSLAFIIYEMGSKPKLTQCPIVPLGWIVPKYDQKITDAKYEKYLDECGELSWSLFYDKNGMYIDDLQRILDYCDYPGSKNNHTFFSMGNTTHEISTKTCQWLEK